MRAARLRLRAAAAVLAGLAATGPAATAKSVLHRVPLAPPPAAAAPPPLHDSAPAPYDPDLFRLSQVLGALSYLRDLCGYDDGATWREKMNALMTAVGGSSDLRRERMAGAYNKGFRDYELMYRTCTPNAQIVISRYLEEGEKLARDVASRYGAG